MELISSVLTDMWHILNNMSPYILLGFLLSGILHEFMPRRFYTRYLSGNSFPSVCISALFGIPLPLCSCGVIPTAMGLRREGASRGATVSFLIATPQTGLDSIIATYSLMGLPFAVIRPFAALFTALFGGSLVNRLVPDDGASPKSGVTGPQPAEAEKSFAGKLAGALHYGMVDMIADIGKWLVIGLLLAGVITAAVPNEWFALFRDNSLYSILAVLLCSIPMYLCATGSIPIAVALMLKGLTPGAALVLLMAGPASNMASILVIRKVLGRRTMLLYLLSIVAGAIAFGLGIDYLLPREWFTDNLISMSACCGADSPLFPLLCTVVLSGLLLYALVVRKLMHRKQVACTCGSCQAAAADAPHTLLVRGMRCNHCVANVQKALTSTEGVTQADVDLETGRAVVHGSGYDRDQLVQAVKSLGFDAEWQDEAENV